MGVVRWFAVVGLVEAVKQSGRRGLMIAALDENRTGEGGRKCFLRNTCGDEQWPVLCGS